MSKEIRYIAIEGVIGAGKTTLAKMLAEKYNARLICEQFEENPFLSKFYDDIKRYAFQTQIFFLLSRYKQQQVLHQVDLFQTMNISDYIFDKDKIFAYLNLQEDELKLYENLVSALEKNIATPDLVIYLQSSVDRLMHNIKIRNREIEKSISQNYIEDLNEAYNHFFFRYKSSPLLIVNSTEIDFVNSETDFNSLCNVIFRDRSSAIEYYNPNR